MIKYLPNDINIEDILSYLPKGSYRIFINGLHKRNSYKDIISCEETSDGITEFHVGRNGIVRLMKRLDFSFSGNVSPIIF